MAIHPPAFRVAIKWGLAIVFIGAMAFVWWVQWDDKQMATRQRQSFLNNQWSGTNPPPGCGILPSGNRYCADKP
jgi:hypothetical protein